MCTAAAIIATRILFLKECLAGVRDAVTGPVDSVLDSQESFASLNTHSHGMPIREPKLGPAKPVAIY
jgi:hypothetical protein